jgi:phytoene synthase
MSNTVPLSEVAVFVRRHDPDRFLCALFAPPARREAIFALLALNNELARAREAAKTPLLALMRLQWWRDVIEDAAAGKPPRRHEVAGPLHAAIATGALDPAALLGLANAREIEAEEAGMPSRAAFDAYLRGTAGGLALAIARLLDVPPTLLPAVQQAGALHGLAGVLRNAPVLAAEGRCLLPPDTSPAALAAEGLAAAPTIASRLHGLPRGAVAAALPLVLARRDLRRLAAGGAVPPARGLGDRAAVVLAGLRGRV